MVYANGHTIIGELLSHTVTQESQLNVLDRLPRRGYSFE